MKSQSKAFLCYLNLHIRQTPHTYILHLLNTKFTVNLVQSWRFRLCFILDYGFFRAERNIWSFSSLHFCKHFLSFCKIEKKIRFLPLRKDLNCINSSMYLCMFRNSENNGLFPNTDSGPHVICKYCRKTTVRFKITAQNNRSLANIASNSQVD